MDDTVPSLIIDNWGLGDVKKVSDSRIVGTAKHSTGSVPDNFACHFIIEINVPFEFRKLEDGIVVLMFSNPPLNPLPRREQDICTTSRHQIPPSTDEKSVINPLSSEKEKGANGHSPKFPSSEGIKGWVLQLKIATSFIRREQAEINLNRENWQ